MEHDLRLLQDKLIDGFIRYQWRLEHPMPTTDETKESIERHYLTDSIFHAKVCSLAAGVTGIVVNWLKEND
jgi:hypothetical protein